MQEEEEEEEGKEVGAFSLLTALIPVSSLFTSPHLGGRAQLSLFSTEGLQEVLK